MTAQRIPRLAVVVCFMNEAEHLPLLLSSVEAQSEPPEQMLLVDDGSRDASHEIAAAFARRHPWARVLRRPPKPHTKDRLASAGELLAFQWGVEHLDEHWEIVVKLDGDLKLNERLFEAVRRRFRERTALGIAGPHLSIVLPSGELCREPSPPEHVRGATKFYRRECFRQIGPVPAILGWDTIDELRARSLGWESESFEVGGGDCVHLRPTGTHDGRLRSLRRKGRCAWGYRAHPLWVLLGAAYRMREPPLALGGVNYLWGWLAAAVSRQPRAEQPLGERARQEELAALRRRLRGVPLARAVSSLQVR